jgi:hypothetical protein
MDLARSATISGTVVESGSLAPIQGVPVDVIDASCNLIAVGVTDELGNYTAAGFTGGTYYVHANARFANYVGELFPDIKRVDPCFPDPITDGAPITVTGTQNVGSIDFQLDQGATISGFVSDANGILPQFRAQARLYALDGTQLFVAFNDRPDGSYRLQGLQAGDYNVVLSGSGLGTGLIDEIFDDIACPRNSCPPGTGVTISLAPGQDRTGISAELELGSQISGRLTDGAGNPLANTLVAVYNDVGEYAGFASSDANGDYTTSTGFPAGDYLVSNQFAINQPTPVAGGFLPVVWPDVACGEPCDFLLGDPITVDGVNPVTGIDLVFQTGSSIAGVVTGDGVPVSGVEVRLLDAEDGSLIRSTNSAADGTYAFEGIGADDYLLRTSNALGLDDQLYPFISCNPFCDPLSGTPVVVAPDTDVTGIDFPLTSTPQIVGTVTDDTGAPAGGVRVEAYNGLGALIASTSSAPDGSVRDRQPVRRHLLRPDPQHAGPDRRAGRRPVLRAGLQPGARGHTDRRRFVGQLPGGRADDAAGRCLGPVRSRDRQRCRPVGGIRRGLHAHRCAGGEPDHRRPGQLRDRRPVGRFVPRGDPQQPGLHR